MHDTSDRIIWWVDGGAPSGLAYFNPSTSSHGPRFESCELSFTDLGERLDAMLPYSAAIGYEAFTIRPGSGRFTNDTSALEVNGMVRWLAHKHGVQLLKPRQPGDRSLGERHLKTVKWYNPGLEDANVAASHLLSWLLESQQLPRDLLEKITSTMS